MLKRDLIMVQIEELSKVIATMLDLRNTDAARKIPELIQVVYKSLDISSDYLLVNSPDNIRAFLNQDDNGGLQRMEIAAKTLIEESCIYQTKKQEMILKAQELLAYIQQEDNTFSLERESLLHEIKAAQ